MKYSCYHIIHLGCFMGCTMHFYIIFGTNLLTQSPVPVPVFSLVSVFRRKGISNGVEREWNLLEKLFLEGKQPGRLGVHVKEATRKAWGRGGPTPLGALGPPGVPWWIVSPLGAPPQVLLWPIGSLLVHKKPTKSFAVFGLCLVFLFCDILKQGKNINWHWALG